MKAAALIIITGIITCGMLSLHHIQAQPTVGEDCSPQGIASCVEGFANLARQSIPKHLDETCRILQGALDCIDRKSKGCIGNEELKATYPIISRNVNDMCSPQSKMRMAYDKHRQCLESISNEYSKCEASLQDVLTRPDKDGEQSLAKTCCGINQMTDCVISVTTDKCGADAATFPKEAMRIGQSASIYETQCKRYKAGATECQPYIFTPSEPSENKDNSGNKGNSGTSADPKPKGNQGISLMVSFDLLVFTVLAYFIIAA